MGKFKFQKVDKKEANKGKTFMKKINSVSNNSSRVINNPSFYYYKDKNYGKDIENFQFENIYEELFKIDGAKTFELTTVYPGLLIGSGYNHPKLKDNNDDFQLGFFFDHTTGLPVISGSSIKGLLKSVFEKKELMQDFYGETVDNDKIKEIFTQGVVFYDAYIIKTKHKQKHIFGNDYITSHHSDDAMGIFKEPNPVKFLKILPEVTFRFQFDADDGLVKLFENILLDFGIGAKTNVGYGQFCKN